MAQGRKQRQAVVSTVTNSEEFLDRVSNVILIIIAAYVSRAASATSTYSGNGLHSPSGVR